MAQLLTISGSPHVHTRRSVSTCMWRVILALLPALACSLYVFGLGAFIVTATSIIACMAFEYAITRWMLHRAPTLADGSAVLTGLLLAFNLPSNLPVWIVVIGAAVAIGIAKMPFGGLGCNIWNPALVGRVFLLISFPVQMTSWPLPLVGRAEYADATTGATTLGMLKLGELTPDDINLMDSAIGAVGGSLGEVSAIALLLGALFLIATRVITWHIPVAVLGSVALFSLCIGASPAVELLSGGLILGACFMATDYVTSPMTGRGMLLFGIMIGIITIIIRKWGAYPEGVSFAILLMNSFVPLIDRYIKPRRFGERRNKTRRATA